MPCSACGRPMTPGEQFCSACGAPSTPPLITFLDPLLIGRQVHISDGQTTKLTSAVAQIIPDPYRPGVLTIVTQSGSRYIGCIGQDAPIAPLPPPAPDLPRATQVLPTIPTGCQMPEPPPETVEPKQPKASKIGTRSQILRGLTSVVAVIVGVLVMRACITAVNVSTPSSTPPRATSSQSHSAPTPSVPVGPQWEYSSSEDAMRGEARRVASLKSETVIYLNRPYHGGSSVALCIRSHPKFGSDIFFSLDNGQFFLDPFGDSISVKFDDGPIENFRCVGGKDSTDLIFISNYKGFLAKLKTSKRLIVELPFFQEGEKQLSFSTAGLEWD